MLERLKAKEFEVLFESHAVAILERDFPTALGELENVLEQFEIPITEIIGSGGGETKGTQRLRKALSNQGWRKTNFEIKKSIRYSETNSHAEPVHLERLCGTHEVDDAGTSIADLAGDRFAAFDLGLVNRRVWLEWGLLSR